MKMALCKELCINNVCTWRGRVAHKMAKMAEGERGVYGAGIAKFHRETPQKKLLSVC